MANQNIFTPSFWDDIEGDLWDALDELVLLILISGVESGTSLLPPSVRVLVDWDRVNMNVLDYATRYRYSLIKGITDTTRTQVQKAVTDWIREGTPLHALEAKLGPLFGEARADRIAATEVTRVYAEGNREAWESTGLVEEMRFNASEDERVCEICGPLDGTHIGVGDIDAIPPVHVSCRCWLTPVVDEKAFGEQLEEILS